MTGLTEMTISNIENGKPCSMLTAEIIIDAIGGEVTYEMIRGNGWVNKRVKAK